ncbi:MAG: type II secretion system protein [Archaeoglobaceae archaeon]
MKKGWTLTEMVVTIGVMGAILALAGEMAVWTIRAGKNLQNRREEMISASLLTEQVIGTILRAKKVKVEGEGLLVVTEEGTRLFRKEFEDGMLKGRLEFDWGKGNLLSVNLKLEGEEGRVKEMGMKIFVPLWKRGDGG